MLYIDDMPRIPASELHGDLCGIRINATLYGSTQLCKEDHEAELCNEFMKTEPLQRLVLAVTSSTLAFLGEAFSILGRLKTSKTHGLAKPRHPFHSGDRPVMGEEAPEQEGAAWRAKGASMELVLMPSETTAGFNRTLR